MKSKFTALYTIYILVLFISCKEQKTSTYPIPRLESITDSPKNHDQLFFELHEIFGDNFNPQEYPYTQILLNNIMKEMRLAEYTIKNHYLRPRPTQLDTRLNPLKQMSTPSFASGHTIWAYLHAYLMGALVPSKKSDFEELAYNIGYTRELMGIHYPSDEEASRIMAHRLLVMMWKSDSFAKDFENAQSEWPSSSEII